MDNEAAISMAKCNEDCAGNKDVTRRYHYVRRETALKEHVFKWIGTKNQLSEKLTKSSNAITFSLSWSVILHECRVFLVLIKRGVKVLVLSVSTWSYLEC